MTDRVQWPKCKYGCFHAPDKHCDCECHVERDIWSNPAASRERLRASSNRVVGWCEVCHREHVLVEDAIPNSEAEMSEEEWLASNLDSEPVCRCPSGRHTCGLPNKDDGDAIPNRVPDACGDAECERLCDPQPDGSYSRCYATRNRAAELDALERTYWNLRRLSVRQPVRDLSETFAEAEAVLKAAGRMDA